MSFCNCLEHNYQRLHSAGQLVQFSPRHPNKKTGQACIFCGQTVNIQTFKGKKVCINCLRNIPELFMYG